MSIVRSVAYIQKTSKFLFKKGLELKLKTFIGNKIENISKVDKKVCVDKVAKFARVFH